MHYILYFNVSAIFINCVSKILERENRNEEMNRNYWTWGIDGFIWCEFIVAISFCLSNNYFSDSGWYVNLSKSEEGIRQKHQLIQCNKHVCQREINLYFNPLRFEGLRLSKHNPVIWICHSLLLQFSSSSPALSLNKKCSHSPALEE